MKDRIYTFVIFVLLAAALVLGYFAFRPEPPWRPMTVLTVDSANVVVWYRWSPCQIVTSDGSTFWINGVSAHLAKGCSVDYFTGGPLSVDDSVLIRGKKYKGTREHPLVIFITDSGFVETDVPLPAPETAG